VTGCTRHGGGGGHGDGDHGRQPLATYAGFKSESYSDPAHWRCRPDTHDAVCDDNLDITVVRPDGSTTVEHRTPAQDAPVDCFYVYPTVSRDTTPNSDWTPGPQEEDLAIRYQAAQIGSQCRLYAPLYRQVTLGGIGARPPATDPTAPTTTTTTAPAGPAPQAVAYGDVLEAFKHYIANDNKGRGFVLMGHSQGTANLTQLLHSEIEPNAELRSHLVSALLIGGSPRLGADPGAIKACTSADQLSCVVSFASYKEGTGPSGALANPDATCTNPANLESGTRSVLHPVWNVDRHNPFAPTEPPPWSTAGAATDIKTDFVATPGLYSGACVTGAGRYFAISVNADPADPRTDEITGDLGGGNLHIVDVAATSGDLQNIVHTQTKAYVAQSRAHGAKPGPSPTGTTPAPPTTVAEGPAPTEVPPAPEPEES
jgi:hypothetical protein